MKLGKMKMPEKKSADKFDIMGLDEAPESADAESELEGESAGESVGEEVSEAANVMLAEASDEELMAELRKRGLESAADSAEKPSSDEEYLA